MFVINTWVLNTSTPKRVFVAFAHRFGFVEQLVADNEWSLIIIQSLKE